ncbi:MAG: ABC transporter permease [Candidatus Acidiferrum sp.]
MKLLAYLRSLLSTFLDRTNAEGEMEEELRLHIENRADDLERSGLTRIEAERRARIEFGGQERFKEECREERVGHWLETLWMDLRHGLRMLRKSPGFTAVAVLTLALGVGGNAVVFSLAYSVLLRPLPYVSSARIVTLWEENAQKGISNSPASAANFYDWKDQSDVFSSMAGFAEWRFNITGRGEPQSVSGALVTADFFTTLGTQAEQGRTFWSDEDQPGKDNVVVLSERLWKQMFGASTPLRSQTISVNQAVMTVVGVMPQSFAYPSATSEIWVPLGLSAANRANREGKWLRVIARLKPETTTAKARENLRVIASRLEESYEKTNRGWGISLVSLRDSMVKDARPTLWLLLGSVALLLLLACVNVSSLILARGTGRANELAVRFAIGATRGRVVRQLLTESLLLVALGDFLAFLLAFWGVNALRGIRSPSAAWTRELTLDFPAIVFVVVLSLVVVAMIGLAPAIRTSSRDKFEALRRSCKTEKASPRRHLSASRLVIAQISLAFVLMIAAGLLANSFLRLSHVDPGFHVQNVLSAHLSLPRSKYQTDRQQNDFFATVIERIRQIPGVKEAGGVSDLPLLGNRMSFKIQIKNDETQGQAGQPEASVRWVTPSYFQAVGMRLDSGRGFTDHDSSAALPVAIVSHSAAHLLWPSRSPIGAKLRLEEDPRWFTIVGVVEDIKQVSLDSSETAAVYFPYNQKSEAWLNWMSVVVRTSGNPEGLGRAVREQVWSVDHDQPVTNMTSLETYLEDSVAVPRLRLIVIGSFSLIALCISVVGVYGTVSYSVAQRIPEIGIRMALGAERRDVLMHFVGQGLRFTLLGLGIGFLIAIALARAIASQLFGVRPFDGATYSCVAVILGLTALAACYVPARRATKVDPLVALRYE